jgi:outer membrane protein TolC
MRHLILISAIILHTTLQAQELSFEMAREMMMSNNLEIEAARKAVDIAKLELRAARGLRLPNIDFMADYTLMQRDIKIDLGGPKGALSDIMQNIINKGVSNGIIPQSLANLITEEAAPLLAADCGLTLQKHSTLVAAATATQPIYMGGRIDAAIDAANIATQKAEQRLRATINHNLTKLIEQYYGVVLAEENAKLRREIVEGFKHHLSDAEAMEEDGLIAKSELLYVKYRLSEAERELHSATTKLSLARDALAQLIGSENIGNLTDRIFIVDSIYNIDYYAENTVNLNPIIVDTRYDFALTKQSVKLARANLLPEIVAMAGAVIASHNFTNLIPRWGIGIGLRLNIFDGLRKERRYIAANRSSDALFTIIEDISNQARLLTENEYYNTINSLNDAHMTQSSIEFAQVYFNAKEEGFREGITPSSELIDAELELQAARLKQLSAGFDFCKHLAQLLEVSGLSESFDEYREKAIFLTYNLD